MVVNKDGSETEISEKEMEEILENILTSEV
jgi:hypothetical protein